MPITPSKKYIDFKDVQNPDALVKILEAFDTEIDALRTIANADKVGINLLVTLANELKTDLSAHTHAITTTVSGILAELKADYNAHTHDVGGTTSSGLTPLITSNVASDSITTTAAGTIDAADGVAITATTVVEQVIRGK